MPINRQEVYASSFTAGGDDLRHLTPIFICETMAHVSVSGHDKIGGKRTCLLIRMLMKRELSRTMVGFRILQLGGLG